jgi:mannose-6-phosphate isomerase-like protein (cupin superfamily)
MTEAVLLSVGEGADINMGPMAQGWTKLGSRQSDDSLGAWEFTMDGSAPAAPPHIHHGIHEIMVILEGEGDLMIGDRRQAVRAGAFAYAPPGVLHGVVPGGSGTIRALIITTPAATHEAVVAALEKLAAGGPPDPAKMAEAFAGTDIEVAGAPPS